MEFRRRAWRFVIASPAVVLMGLLGASLQNASAAQAGNPTPCPSPTSLLSPVTSTACHAVRHITGTASGAASAAHKTVQKTSKKAKNLTGSLSGSASSARQSSGETSAAGGSTASGSSAHQSHSGAQRHAHRSAAASPAAVGIAPTTVGLLSPLGIPDSLLTPVALAPLAPVSEHLNFPKVYPARHAATRAARSSSRAPGRMWLVILIGVVGLVGGVGGHFLGWPGLRRHSAPTST